MQLGPGRHFGEWWGHGIARKYDMPIKVFSLFNTGRWNAANPPPACCSVVPVIGTAICNSESIDDALGILRLRGSLAAPGFMKPEGIIIYHTAAKVSFKKTLDNDHSPKSQL
jgi:hypothetical protein